MPPMWPGGPPTSGNGNWAYSPIYGWVWVPAPPSGGGGGSGNAPDHTLPGDLPHPDQGLPDSGNKPVNPIDPGGQPEPH
jgi:hypothetical protein